MTAHTEAGSTREALEAVVRQELTRLLGPLGVGPSTVRLNASVAVILAQADAYADADSREVRIRAEVERRVAEHLQQDTPRRRAARRASLADNIP